MDEFTEVTETGWFGRIGGAIKGIVFGLIMFVVAWPLLFWNEGRTIKRTRLLDAGQGAAITVSAATADPANEGQLVHMTAGASTDDVLNDDTFGVSLNAVKLVRSAEMYQWEEDVSNKTEKKLGGGERKVKKYSYDKEWSPRVIKSSGFKHQEDHQNPDHMKYSSSDHQANEVLLEAYKLTPALIQQFDNLEPLTVNEQNAKLPDDAKFSDRGVYVGADPADPQIGDIRINWQAAYPTEVSVLAKQIGNTFESWTPPKGGTTLEQILRVGAHSIEEIIAQEHSENKLFAWLLRGGGLFLMWLGIFLVLKPLAVIADVVPFIGNLVGGGLGIVAFLIALPCTLIAIAIGWFTYRPMLSIALLVGAAACFVGVKMVSGKKKVA